MEYFAIVGLIGVVARSTASERWIHFAKVLRYTVTQNVRLASLTLVLVGVERKDEKGEFSGYLAQKTK